VKKEWEIKGEQRKHHDASTVAIAVGEKAHLGMKQRWLLKNQVSSPKRPQVMLVRRH